MSMMDYQTIEIYWVSLRRSDLWVVFREMPSGEKNKIAFLQKEQNSLSSATYA